ncbi:MAG: hypothetical protein AAGE03_08545 [Pseudomonadota bacterium]
MSHTLEWVAIKKFGDDPIGAIGFLGNDAVAVVAFYDDRDGNRDGEVGIGEWIVSKVFPISMEGGNVTEVAMQGRAIPEIILRDPSFPNAAARMFASFGAGLVIDGAYSVYFAPGVGKIAGTAAKYITQGMVKEFVVRKGFEEAVKASVMTAIGR